VQPNNFSRIITILSADDFGPRYEYMVDVRSMGDEIVERFLGIFMEGEEGWVDGGPSRLFPLCSTAPPSRMTRGQSSTVPHAATAQQHHIASTPAFALKAYPLSSSLLLNSYAFGNATNPSIMMPVLRVYL
jgi:hypothetical protein